jgi:hypothetical protein
VDQPNPFSVAWSVLRVLASVRKPQPTGSVTVDHTPFSPILDTLSVGGLPAVVGSERDLEDYISKLETVDPDTLGRDEALAYWLNLYNAGALRLAASTYLSGEASVLRAPGGFSRPIVTVDGERLSLDAIEHAKIRRFGDPRIHGALVCGSLSCPTLRPKPYTGFGLDWQLDHQMASFLANGGAEPGDGDVVRLSRVLLWYGSDFVRPHRMPTLLPASKRRILEAVRLWLPDGMARRSKVEFQVYDWGLGCAVR